MRGRRIIRFRICFCPKLRLSFVRRSAWSSGAPARPRRSRSPGAPRRLPGSRLSWRHICSTFVHTLGFWTGLKHHCINFSAFLELSLCFVREGSGTNGGYLISRRFRITRAGPRVIQGWITVVHVARPTVRRRVREVRAAARCGRGARLRAAPGDRTRRAAWSSALRPSRFDFLSA